MLLPARAVSRADNRERIDAEMVCRQKAANQGLQRDRIDRNQRRRFPEQPSHGEIS
jgi:hypothetical protein